MDAADRAFARRWYDALLRTDPADWDMVSDRFLRKRRGHGHLKRLADIAKAVEQLHSESAPVEVTVISARKLTEPAKQSLLTSLLGSRNLVVTEHIDPSLIAGAIVRTADEEWDVSVKNQLERLKRFMVEA